MKIIAAGDLHGDWPSLNRLISRKNPDFILQCGDFGWWPTLDGVEKHLYGHTKWSLRGVKPGDKTTVLWCDGNHEDHWELRRGDSSPTYSRVYYMPRGTIYVLPDGRTVLFIGGAGSVDIAERTIGIDWFPEEQISYLQLDTALSHGRIDIVVSHTCPMEFNMQGRNTGKVNDPSRHALSRILEKYRPSLWYFGHWHTFQQGKHSDTRWTCLDQSGTARRWWIDVP